MPETLRTETVGGAGHVVLTRVAEYNTITPTLRDELAAAIAAADDDPAVDVILLRAEGRAFVVYTEPEARPPRSRLNPDSAARSGGDRRGRGRAGRTRGAPGWSGARAPPRGEPGSRRSGT